ncbi:putative bifunctional diguanylate cyclase/phosphodiesterase [Pararhizobium mangrovi]|uniref:EAL domain-containing protein n=1 Tax=Pararhizobium mangrovi TaxID=2590452 RepID=A0A506U1L9_9HYPH|nr:EAL domain-containing protein [Pararhizobium mangrovi]TPW26924.1 EAL domain-containing protein [Pararhizobium mangrovi]
MVENDRHIPRDVYQSLVCSLYADRGTLTAGLFLHVGAGLLIGFKLSDPVYAVSSLVFIVIWLARRIQMRSFDLGDGEQHSRAEILYWERSYILAASSVALTLGFLSGYSILTSRDPFAEFLLFSLTFATLVSAVGRNYGSRHVVSAALLASFVPIIACLLSKLNIYFAFVAIFIVVFGLLVRKMAAGVREFLVENFMASREIAEIAQQFDTALNNMPNGLFMLDVNERIVVANEKAGRLLQIDDVDQIVNHSLKAVLRLAVSRKVFDQDRASVIETQLVDLIRGRQSRALVRLSDDLLVEFTAKHDSESGTVLNFEDVTARVKAEEQVVEMARYDSLTRLANRAYFVELIGGALKGRADGRKIAVAVFDIDDFKHINDTTGHLTGDRLLCEFAMRLGQVAPERLILSRFGGDEFVVFIGDVAGEDDAHELMATIHEAMRGTYFVNGHRLSVGVSGGVAVLSAHEFHLETAQIKADLALYESKRNGKNTWTAFVQEMDDEYRHRQSLMEDLREAIATDALSLVYQPIIDPDRMHVDCCEALSRWTHPEHGSISPVVFIELAEEMGIIGDLTRSVLHTACRDCMTWIGDVSVSVNLSAIDLRDEGILATIRSALDASGLPARRLRVEVTESAFVRDPSKAHGILREIMEMGASVSIDDFGTGYSSLSYLNTLPFDTVKIDRSFVDDVPADERQLKLLKGIFRLSRDLGFDVVIEGVETEEQLQALRSAECVDQIQGYVFGLPLPSASVSELVATTEFRSIPALRNVS